MAVGDGELGGRHLLADASRWGAEDADNSGSAGTDGGREGGEHRRAVSFSAGWAARVVFDGARKGRRRDPPPVRNRSRRKPDHPSQSAVPGAFLTGRRPPATPFFNAT